MLPETSNQYALSSTTSTTTELLDLDLTTIKAGNIIVSSAAGIVAINPTDSSRDSHHRVDGVDDASINMTTMSPGTAARGEKHRFDDGVFCGLSGRASLTA